MKLHELFEARDYAASSPHNKEYILPIYTKTKFDYGSRVMASIKDIVLRASDTGNVYSRRQVAQRDLKLWKPK